MTRYPLHILVFFLALILVVAGSCGQARCEENEDIRTLEMYSGEKPVVSASRSPKPVSQIAEDITVITADDIKAYDAHTVADVLYHVPGVEIDLNGTPGSVSNVTLIHGALPKHILIMLDGVPLNNISDNQADLGVYPVQNIDRIEIIKGPASSSWGPALGGVINIITKNPADDKTLSGMVSASIGTALTGVYRGEATGTSGKNGYYLFASTLRSDGLLPNNAVNSRNYFGKYRRELPRQGNLLLSVGYNEGNRGIFALPLFDVSNSVTYRYLVSSLSLSQPLTDHLNLDLAVWGTWRDTRSYLDQISTFTELQRAAGYETSIGGNAKATWRRGMHNLVAGVDYSHGGMKIDNTVMGGLSGDRRIDRVGIYANDTVTFWRFSVTPGVRYDINNTNGDFFSPSLGVTFRLTDHTVLRGIVGRGFSLPVLLFDHNTEKVLSYQAGIESSELPYLWLKATWFRNSTWDVSHFNSDTGISSLNKELKKGIEVEVKTVPVFNTSLAAGYVYIDATNKTTGAGLRGIPRHTVDVGLYYNDNRTFRGALVGHFVDWNINPVDNGKYHAMIWDLHLAQKVFTADDTAAELFFSAHNLFNGAQYSTDIFKNPRRWFEGGFRYHF